MTWNDVWTAGPDATGDTVHGVSATGRAHIVIPVGTAVGDLSPFIRLEAQESVITMDTDDSDLAPAGAFTMDVRRSVGARDAIASTVVVASLSSGTTSTFNAPPGDYVLRSTAISDSTGNIQIRGRGRNT